VVLAVSLFEIMMAVRWEEIIQFALGLWLAVSIFVLDYGAAGQLCVWHFVIGALVALVAAIEFWQDSLKKS
jgi:membrane protein YdbS with pleckstrin-like domain